MNEKASEPGKGLIIFSDKYYTGKKNSRSVAVDLRKKIKKKTREGTSAMSDLGTHEMQQREFFPFDMRFELRIEEHS